jgi:hypothetical protein
MEVSTDELHRAVERMGAPLGNRLPESVGAAAQLYAERDRRKVSSFLALIIEDAIKAMQGAERSEKPAKARKP